METSQLEVVKHYMRACRCAVVLDIDETLLYSLHKWTQHIRITLGVEDLTVEQVMAHSGFDRIFYGSDYYEQYRREIRSMCESEELHSNLTVIEGAQPSIQQLLCLADVQVIGYLTARPENVLFVTRRDLQTHGFPARPIIARPRDVPREDGANWKASILHELAQDYDGTLMMIDDDIHVAQALLARNQRMSHPVISILYDGPLYRALIAREGLQTDPAHHFYLANWSRIPAICAQYISLPVNS
ncbi:MAG TPA: hypothetical protein VL461_12585 [Dictyobacter sp.]|nr:hypothetical protein [Dictyobacter sp.]